MTAGRTTELAGPASPSRRLYDALRGQIERGELRAGSRLRSLREVTRLLGATRHAVLSAYRELAGLGLVEARHGSGFYVSPLSGPGVLPPQRAANLDRILDSALLIRGLVEPTALLKCGSGSLPPEWLRPLGLHRQVRSVASLPAANLHDYGTALGYAPLRELLRRRLERRRIRCTADQILLTTGITQGLELVVRGLCQPGDSVLVESPGYYNLFGLLHLAGVRPCAIPRTAEGPDLPALQALLERGERPRILFVQSLLHNPTGSSIAPAVAHRLLLLAEKYDFVVAEDDAYGDLAEDDELRLAALDEWRRVIHLSGFTKTISAGLRVGFAVASEQVVDVLGRVKLLSSITTSEFVERVIHRVLSDGGYDRFTAALRRRLAEAQERWQGELQAGGWIPFPGPRRGMFVWTRHPSHPESLPLARAAASAGFWLAPGSAFDPEHASSPWVRFNVAYRSPALTRWLAHPR
jgi:DNA-binding transcriptional MocR family regulator